jgi:hypothetical protein
LVLIACALGFWLQERRLSTAKSLLAAHGLALEWADLQPGQVRATVIDRVDSGSYVLLTVRLQALRSASVFIRDRGNVRLGTILSPIEASNAWAADVQILVDTINPTATESIIKTAFSVGSRSGMAHMHSTQNRPDVTPAAELVRIHATGSSVHELGEPIPLCDIGDEKFEIVVD